MITDSKMTVVGAGAVGSSVAYASLIRGSVRHIALYDVAAEKADAEALDLAHGSHFAPGVEILGGGADLGLTADSDVVVITAGAKQKPGQTRLDLAETNAQIMDSLLPPLLEASPQAVFVIVTNPCDPLTTLAQRSSGLPPERIFASGTVLDTSRLRWLIAQRAGVATNSVHAHIVGEHGDSEFALWSTATIGNVPILDWTRDGRGVFTREDLDHILSEVQGAAYKVIQGKGATNDAIGLSSARIVEAIVGDQHAVVNVAPVLSNFRGIDGIAMSVPCVVSAAGAFPVQETPFSQDEIARLKASAETLNGVVESLA